MTGLIITAIVLAVAAVLLWARRRRAGFPAAESLGNPHPDRDDPLIRTESRHRDTPGAADIHVHGGREHRG